MFAFVVAVVVLNARKESPRKHRALGCGDCEKRHHVKRSGASQKQLKSILARNWVYNVCLLRNLPFSNEVNLNIFLECEQHTNYLNVADVDEGLPLANIKPQVSQQTLYYWQP